ncbi:MAG: P-type conjugative transfer protein TrbL [Gammaproteobacteria bacterium]
MMKKFSLFKSLPLIALVSLLFFSMEAHAALGSEGLFDNVLGIYQKAASGWAKEITKHATWLFWTLALISMIWTFGFMALRKADIGEFFAEFIRFMLFTGFFWWLLINGPQFASDIIESLKKIGAQATGLPNALSPSSIVDLGFGIVAKVAKQSTVMSPVTSAVLIIMALIILTILALIAVNMLLLLASGWVLAYGGIFFLGFGGSRWTSDMAINYYKTVLGIAASLFTMVLIVGVGKTFLDEYHRRMSAQDVSIDEMSVMLIVVIILLSLVNKVPSLVAGIITGSSVGGSAGVGGFGAGAAVGAGSMAIAAASVGGSVLASGAANAAGGAQALMAAVSKAYENIDTGGGMASDTGAGSGSESSGGESSSLASAMGNGSSGGNASASSSNEKSRQSESSASSDAGEGGKNKANDSSSTDSAPSSGNVSSASMSSENRSGSSTSPNTSGNRASSSSSSSGSAAGTGNPTAAPNSGSQKPSNSNSNAFKSALSSAKTAVTTAARFTGDVGANLAKSAYSVGKEKFDSSLQSAKDRISETAGGQMAQAIQSQSSQNSSPEPIFDQNNLSASQETAVDFAAEVAAFCEKKEGE